MNRDLQLFHVKDADRPMFVVATDFAAALEAWKTKIREENVDEPFEESELQPQGVDFVCDADELLLPGGAK